MHVLRLSDPAAIAVEPARRRTVEAAGRRPSAAVYRRRRLVAAVFASLALLGVGQMATSAISGEATAVATDRPGAARSTVVVQPGDTLWALAHRHRGSTDHGWYVDALIRLNGSASIQAGQVLVLP